LGEVEYELLRRVTHWSDDEVERERTTTEADVRPSYTLEKSFDELLEMFHFAPFIDRSNEHVQIVVDVWKKIVDVQQHFNDLELRIRNYAVTLVVALMGAAAFAFKDHLELTLRGVNIPLASGLLLCALLGWGAFYFMDRFWYHRLLYGAVAIGARIERRLKPVLPQIGLTESISEASPLKLWRWKIRTTLKIDLFYGGIALGLLIMAIVSFLAHDSATNIQPDPSPAGQKRPAQRS
jgi:hypothetical protein